MRIGIFDSGIGGKAIATELMSKFPSDEIISVNDKEHLPYGNREPNEIISLTEKAIQPLLNSKCNVIVIACNTATTVAISTLRSDFPNTPFIGVEPMIKPATDLTKTKCIAVCATPATLQSNSYKQLKNTWASGIKIIEPDCHDWAELIEKNQSNKIKIDYLIKSLLRANVDVIVLGCTHYHWIKQRIIDEAGPSVIVIEPTESIAKRVKKVLSDI